MLCFWVIMKDDPQIVARVLELLQQWGWETGYKKLEVELQANGEGESEARHFFLGWMAAERGSYEQAIHNFEALAQVVPLAAWALIGQAFVAMRRKDLPLAQRLIDRCSQKVEIGEDMLRATIDHLQGSVLYHQ